MTTKKIAGKLTPLAFALTLSFSATCSQDVILVNPLVRVDLTDKIPAKARRRLPAAIRYDCHKIVDLQIPQVKVQLVINWRVLDIDGSRFIAAVDVAPHGSGQISGFSTLNASATVGQLKNVGQGDATIATAPVEIGYQGRKGCSSVSGAQTVTLRGDVLSNCKKPKGGNLLVPVN